MPHRDQPPDSPPEDGNQARSRRADKARKAMKIGQIVITAPIGIVALLTLAIFIPGLLVGVITLCLLLEGSERLAFVVLTAVIVAFPLTLSLASRSSSRQSDEQE